MQNSDLTKFLLDRNIDQKPKDQLASAYLCEAESLLKTLESDPTNPDHEETRSLAIAFTLKSFDLSLPAKNSDIIFRASQIYWRLCSENFNKNGSDHIPTLLKFSTALEQSNHSNVSWRIQILLQISNIYYKLNQYSESGKFCLCAVRLSKTLYSRVVYLKYLKSCVELLYKCGSLRDKGSVSQLENEVAGDEFMQFFLLVELCCLGIRSTDVLDPSYVESKLKSSKTVDDRVIVRWAVVNYARFLRQNKKMEFARTILDIKPGRDSSSWVYALQKYAEIEMQLSDSSTSNEIDTMLTELENILKLCVSKSYPLFVIEDGCILGWEILCNIPGKNYDNRKFVKQKLSFLRLATEILEKSDSRLTSLQSTIHLELSKIYDVIGNPSIAKRHLEAAKISDNETIKKDENVSGSNDFEQAMLLIEKAKTRSPDKLCKKMLEKAFQLIIPGYTFLPPFSIIESNSEYIAHAESISNSPKLCQFLFDLLNLCVFKRFWDISVDISVITAHLLTQTSTSKPEFQHILAETISSQCLALSHLSLKQSPLPDETLLQKYICGQLSQALSIIANNKSGYFGLDVIARIWNTFSLISSPGTLWLDILLQSYQIALSRTQSKTGTMVNVEMLVLYFGLSYADMSLKEFDAGGNSSVEKGGTPKGGKVVTNTTSTVKTVDDICRVCANVKSMDVKMKLWFANIWDRLQNAKSITQTSPGKFELIESDKLLRILTSLNALENKRKPIDPISIAQDINSTTITDEEITIQIWIRLAKCAHQIGNNEVAFECLQNISEEKLYKKPKLSGLFYFVKGKVLKSLYSEKKFTASQNLMGFEIVECFTSALEVIVSQVDARIIGVSEILVEICEWIQETGVKNSTQCDFVADKVSKAFLNPLLDNSFWHEFMKSDGGKLLLQILSFFKGRAGCVDDKEAEKLVRCIPLKYRTYKIEDEPPKSGSSRPVSSKSKNYSDSFVASMKKIENLVFNRNKINNINEEVNDLQTCFDTVKELLTIFTSYCGSKPFEETTTVRIKSAGQKDGKRSKETAELEKSRTITTENEWLISGWNEYSIFCAKNLFELCAGSKQNIELLCKLWLYVLSYACQKFSKYELYSQNLAILNLMDLISCSAFDSKSLYSNWNYAIYNSVGNALNQTNRSAVGIKWYAKATMFTLESPIFHSEVHVEDLQMYLFAIRVLIDKGSLDSAAEVHSFATSFNHLDLNEWWILGTEIALKSRRYQTAIESASKFPGTLSSENYFRVLELFEECIDEYTPNILLVHIFSMMQHNIATFKNRSLDDIWMKRTKGRVLGLLGKLFSQIALIYSKDKNQFEQLLEEIRKIFKSTTFGKGVDEKFLELSVNSDVDGISDKTTAKIISNLIETSVRFYTKSFEIFEQCEDVFGTSKTINQFAKIVAEITNLNFFLPEKMDTFTMRKMILNCRDILKRGKVFLENVECLPSDIFSKWKERIFVEFQIAIEDLNAEICYSIENLEEKKLQKNREYLIQKFLSENEEMIAINKEWDETKATICEEVQTGNLKFEKTLRSDLRHALKQKNELMFRISEDTTDQTVVWKEITASLTECLQSFIGQKNFLFAYVACLEAFELSINRRFEVEHQTAFSLLATLQSCANSISAKQILKNIGSNQFRNGRRLLDFSSSDSPKKFDLQTQIGYYQTTDKIFSEIKPSTPSAIEELLKSAPKNVKFIILQHSIDGKRLYYGVYASIRTATTPSAGKKQSQKSPEESSEIYVKAGCVNVSLEEMNELLKLIKLQEKVMKESRNKNWKTVYAKIYVLLKKYLNPVVECVNSGSEEKCTSHVLCLDGLLHLFPIEEVWKELTGIKLVSRDFGIDSHLMRSGNNNTQSLNANDKKKEISKAVEKNNREIILTSTLACFGNALDLLGCVDKFDSPSSCMGKGLYIDSNFMCYESQNMINLARLMTIQGYEMIFVRWTHDNHDLDFNGAKEEIQKHIKNISDKQSNQVLLQNMICFG